MQITEQEREERRLRKIRRWSYRTGVSEKDKTQTLSLQLSRLGKRKQPAWLENANIQNSKQALSADPNHHISRAASKSPGKPRHPNTSSTEALSPVPEINQLSAEASGEDNLMAHIDNDLEAELEMELEAQLKNIATAAIGTERSPTEARFARCWHRKENDTSLLVKTTRKAQVEVDMHAEFNLHLPEDASTKTCTCEHSQAPYQNGLPPQDTALNTISGTDSSKADLVAELEAALEAQVANAEAPGVACGTGHY